MPVGDDNSVRAARALSLPTRSAILGHLLKAGSLTAREIAGQFNLHPNVARAHLDLLVEAGFLATGVRRKGKGRPAKVYFTWEGEMTSLDDWEVSPQAGGFSSAALHETDILSTGSRPARSINPHRLIAAIFVRLVERLSDEGVYELAEEVAKEEGRKLVQAYRAGGLDFPAAVRAMVEELRRFSEDVRIVRLDDDSAEIETDQCAFRDIALEHSDLVIVLDTALKEGALLALGYPSEIELEASVARGDPVCREVVRRIDPLREKRIGTARQHRKSV